MDPNDSEGSWEFVDKDSDSDTSSVASQYDTGLPDELSSQIETQENAWGDHDDFITDSDIEACAEGSAVGSDDEADITINQDVEEDIHDQHTAEVLPNEENSVQDSQSSSDTVTRSMIDYDEKNSPQTREETKQEDAMELPVEDGQAGDASSSLDYSSENDHIEEVTSQKTINASFNDDLIQSPGIDSDVQAASVIKDQSISPPPSILSNASSESDFERISSSNDLMLSDPTFEPEVKLEDTKSNTSETDPKEIPEDLTNLVGAEESDTGSVDFTVISAPASPPVEIVSQETTTSYVAENDVPTDRGTVGMMTEETPANSGTVGTATEPTSMRTVGVVTDHFSQPNQRLLMSIMMISFGVGFIVGRCPIPDSSTVFQLQEKYTVKEALDDEIPGQTIQHLYHSTDNPSQSYEVKLPDLRENQIKIDHKRYYLMAENSRIKSQNHGLRMTIRKLKEENKNLMSERSKRFKIDESNAISMNVVRQSYQKLQRISEKEIESKNKEIKQLETRVLELEQDSSFLNTSMTLYRKLQDQHSALMKMYEKFTIDHEHEKSELMERQSSMKLKLQRYRSESKNLIQQLTKAKTHNLYLKMLLDQQEVRHFEEQKLSLQDSDVKSPLLEALSTNRGETCSSGSKYRSQVKQLKIRVRSQRSLIRKYEQEMNLKSMALEMLYNSRRELSNYATCLIKQQSQVQKKKKEDIEGICRSSSKSPPSTPKSEALTTQQCTYQVNGTLALDFTTMNISVQNFSYELKLSSDGALPALYFNATPLLPICKRHYADRTYMTSDPKTQNNYVPAVLYTHALMNTARSHRELDSQKAKYLNLHKVCAAKNWSLDVSRKETENAENRLVVVSRELKRLRKDKKNLDQKLKNVTAELEKKPTMKQCLDSALDTDAILKKVNGTKAYKSASKMAQKVKKATDKAWKKLSKFMHKLGHSDDHDDEYRDHRNGKRDIWQHDGDQRRRKCHKNRRHYENQRNHDNHEDDHETRNHGDHENRKTQKQHHDFPDKHRHHNIHKKQDHRNKKPKFDESKNQQGFQDEVFGPMTKKRHREIKKMEETMQKSSSQYPRVHEEGFKKKNNKNKRNKGKRQNFHGNGNNLHKEQNKQRKDERKKWNEGKRQQCHKKNNFGRNRNKRNIQFRDVFRKHVKIAKVAGERIVTGLMPIYHKWQEMYCDVEKRFLPKSFSEIWESLVEDETTSNVGNGDFDDDINKGKSSFVNMDWGWQLYRNLSDFISPVIELPEKIELPSWGVDWREQSSWAPTVRRSENNDVDSQKSKNFKAPAKDKSLERADLHLKPRFKKDDDVVLPPGRNAMKDPQWFTHMFQAREDLRKDWGDSPLSEEEFDWFLKMFEAREELRRSGDGYPGDHGNNNELDWFLKMFEARARLRFENKQDEENWYLKISEARNKARSEAGAQYPDTESKKGWYMKMFKARENLRKHDDDDGGWYINMAEERQKARERWSAERNGIKDEWCMA